MNEIYRYHQVDAHLSSSGQPTETQLARLAHEGFQVVINLVHHDDPLYIMKNEDGLVHSLGMEYVHIPVILEAPKEEDLQLFFQAMDTYEHQKILVHCASNRRASAFIGLYLALKKHHPEQEAFALMKAVWQPDPVWQKFIERMLTRHRL